PATRHLLQTQRGGRQGLLRRGGARLRFLRAGDQAEAGARDLSALERAATGALRVSLKGAVLGGFRNPPAATVPGRDVVRPGEFRGRRIVAPRLDPAPAADA